MSIIIKNSNNKKINDIYESFKSMEYDVIYSNNIKDNIQKNGLYITNEKIDDELYLYVKKKYNVDYIINYNIIENYIYISKKELIDKYKILFKISKKDLLKKYNFKNIDISRQSNFIKSKEVKLILKEYSKILKKKINHPIIYNKKNIIITTDLYDFITCIYNECNVFLFSNDINFNNELDNIVINNDNFVDKINNYYNIDNIREFKENKLIFLSLIYQNYSLNLKIKNILQNI